MCSCYSWSKVITNCLLSEITSPPGLATVTIETGPFDLQNQHSTSDHSLATTSSLLNSTPATGEALSSGALIPALKEHRLPLTLTLTSTSWVARFLFSHRI